MDSILEMFSHICPYCESPQHTANISFCLNLSYFVFYDFSSLSFDWCRLMFQNERDCIMSYRCEFDRSSHSRCKHFLCECQQYKRAIHICPKDFCCIYRFLAVGARELPYWLYTCSTCVFFISFLLCDFSHPSIWYVCLSVLSVSALTISVKSNFIHILFLPLNSLTVFQISPESLLWLTSPPR